MLDRSQKMKISGFIRRCAYDANPANKLVVRHISAGNRFGNEVVVYQLSPSISPDDLEVLVNQIEEVTVDDAEGLASGLQKYAILAEREGGEKYPGRCLFAIAGSDDMEEGLDSEPANANGLVRQLMRHLEVVQRTAQMGTGHIIQMQARTIEQLAEQNQKMQSKHLEVIDNLEQLKSEQFAREIEAKREEVKMNVIKDMASKVQTLLPLVVNKLGGKKLLPEKTTSGEQMVMGLMESLKPEQMEKIAEVLSPEQMTVIMQVYQNMQERDSQIKEDKPEEKKE